MLRGGGGFAPHGDELDPHLNVAPESPRPSDEAAEQAALLAGSDPRGALRLAEETLSDKGAAIASKAVACRAAATALVQLGDLPQARRKVEEGLALARSGGIGRQLAELRATSAQLEFHAGRPERALAEIEEGLAEAVRAGEVAGAASLLGQRAYVYFRTGRFEEGMAGSNEALDALDAAGEEGRAFLTVRARVLSNRALAQMYRASYGEVLSDLEGALELHLRAGAELLAAQVTHNIGCAASYFGDVPEATRRFEETRAAYLRLGLPTHSLLADEGELFRKANLLPEARQAAARAVAVLEEVGLASDLAEARLGLAEACLADGDVEAALAALVGLEEEFDRQGSHSWAIRAADVRRRALSRRDRGDDRMALYHSALLSAEELEMAGFRLDGCRARLEAALSALRTGHRELAGAAVAPLVGSEPSGEGDEALFVHARAISELALGREEDALLLLAGGLKKEGARAGRLLSATGKPGHRKSAGEMSETALAVVLSRGDPLEVLSWAERSRPFGAPVDPERLISRLGGALLVELVEHQSALFGVALSKSRCELVELGPVSLLGRARSAVQFASASLFSPRGSTSSRQVTAELLLRSLRELDEAFSALAPDYELSEARGVVVVPAGGLHGLCWPMLRRFHTVPVTVAPSGASYRAVSPAPVGADSVVLVAGPGLRGAEEEVHEISEVVYNGRAEVLEGPAATRDAVAAALGHRELAHLAAHGSFRSDNPYMSSFELFDGPLTLYEIAAARPRLRSVVLSSCEAGRVASHAGEELSGPVPSLMGFGAGAVIAPVAPVPDKTMPAVSLAVHEELFFRSAAPDEALRAVRRRFGAVTDLRPEELAAMEERAAVALLSSSLVCYGPGTKAPGNASLRLGDSFA